jgi:uncharacterized membrane protein YbhN (UPF0104 family)/tRNA A-37 threonylcarbamoyl transferase component Bud32
VNDGGSTASFGARRDALGERIRSLGRYGFARASEEPYRRRPADAFALFFGALVVALLAWHSDDPTKFEDKLTETFAELPSSLHGIAEFFVDLGTLWALGIIVVAALLARRWRLTRDLFLAGLLAWFVGHVIALALGNESLGDIVDAITHADSTAAQPFPLVRIAVVAAVVAAASPYLGRPARWLSYVVVVLMVPSALYLGIASGADAVGGIALGVAAGALVHLAFGSPGGRPTVQQVELALASLGVEAHDIRLAPVQTLGRTLMLAEGPDGPLAVTVLGRDERDARFLNKAVRFLFYRDSGPTLFHSRLQEVEHEAFILLRAQREGVRTPEFVEVGQAGPDAAVLVVRQADGRPLADLAPDAVTDELLGQIWDGVARFQHAGLAHGRLDPTNVYVQDDGSIVFVGWRNASVAAPRHRLGADVATLLYTTSLLVGADRAVAAALRALGKDELAAAVPFVQPPVVRRDLRKGQKGVKTAFEDLRAEVAAAAGVEVPELEQLRRVSRRQVVMFAAACFGIWAMISMVGDPAELWDTIQTANWAWVVLAFGCWIVVELGYSISMLGAIPPANDVPFGPLTLLQVASAFLNLVTSGMIAQFVMNTRFLQKRGVDVPTAVSASAVPPIAYTLVQIVVVLVALVVGHSNELSLSDIGGSDSSSGGDGLGIVLLCIVGIALVIGAVLIVPKWRNKVMPTVRTTAHNLWTVFTSPRKIVFIFGGSILTQLMYALILWSCVRAYGGDLALADIILVNTFVSLFGGLIPVPGGIGVFEAGLTAGLTAFGVDPAIATAAVLTDRMITAYIPPVFGYVSINWMTKHDYL